PDVRGPRWTSRRHNIQPTGAGDSLSRNDLVNRPGPGRDGGRTHNGSPTAADGDRSGHRLNGIVVTGVQTRREFSEFPTAGAPRRPPRGATPRTCLPPRVIPRLGRGPPVHRRSRTVARARR